MKYCCVFSTIDSLKKAREIAGLLVSRKLAACVSIISGLESHYCWKGKKEKTREYMLFIKTRTDVYKKLEKTLRRVHPYQVPEILCIPILKGSQSYLDWLDQGVRR